MVAPLRPHSRAKAVRRQSLVIAAIVGLAKADAVSMGVVAPALKSDLHITEAQLGLLASLAAVTGALAALPAGTLVDRRHRIMVVTVALVGWSVALGLAGFAQGLFLLAVARVLSGGIATVARPVAVSLAGDFYQSAERGRALAALDTGQAIGTAVCFGLGALAVHLFSWRWLFFWLAAIGVTMAVVSSRLEEPVRTGPPGPPLGLMLRALVTIRTNLIVLVADAVGNFFYAGAASFAVLFISERYGLSNATVDALAPILAAGVVAGILVGGRVGDRLTRARGGEERVVLAATCQLVAAAMFGIALLCDSVVQASVFLFIGSTVLGGAGPCLDAVRIDIVPAGMRGRAEASRGLLLLGSGALGPVTFGLVATAFGGHSDGLALRDAFLVMLGPLGVGSLILFAAVRPYQADARAAGVRPFSGALTGHAGGVTIVYTDGACSGNPGPGGWAWAVPAGPFRSGSADYTTNQRMEVTAVLEAVRTLNGPLEVVSDSTYVVNCFRDRWWEGWLRRGWTNSAKKPVANRDLWEPLIDAYRVDPQRLRFRWVKGHGGDPMNDLVDRLAVEAAGAQVGRSG